MRNLVVTGTVFVFGVALAQGCGGSSKKSAPPPTFDDGGEAGTASGDAGSGPIGGGGAGAGGLVGEPGAGAGGAAGDSGNAGDSGAAGAGAAGAGGEGGEGGATSGASWHLWVLDKNSAHLYGYAPSQLETTNGDAPEIDITLADVPTLNGTNLQFDAHGDLWLTVQDSYRFPAAELQHTGTAHVAAVLARIGGNFGRVAFDPAGNLWRSTYSAPLPDLSRFNAAAIATLSTTVTTLTPDFTSTEARDYPLTFDEQGNLYTGFEGTEGPTTSLNYFGRYDAAQLVGNVASTAAPALSIKPYYSATDLARTPAGDFVLVNGTAGLLRYSKAQMAQSGLIQAITPAATITLDASVTPTPNRIAVDPDGNWYLSQTSTFVHKIASADAAKSGTVTVTPVMTLRAQAGDVNASFQAITVH